jgi:hypothetical protein
MPHIRIGIIGDMRPLSSLLALILGKHKADDVLIVYHHSTPISVNNEALTLQILRADIPLREMHALAIERAVAQEITLEEVFKSAVFEEYIPSSLEPLPRAPKRITPKKKAPRHHSIHHCVARRS